MVNKMKNTQEPIMKQKAIVSYVLALVMMVSSVTLTANRVARAQAAALERLRMFEIGYNVDNFILFASKGNHEIVETFIRAGMSPDLANDNGDRALIIAAEKGHMRVLNTLIKQKADLNVTDLDGSTALMYAAYYHQDKVVELLVEQGANVNIQNRAGMTALMYAVMAGNIECIDLLLTKDTDIMLRCKLDLTAIALARQKGFMNIARYIQEKMDYLLHRHEPERKEMEIHNPLRPRPKPPRER